MEIAKGKETIYINILYHECFDYKGKICIKLPKFYYPKDGWYFNCEEVNSYCFNTGEYLYFENNAVVTKLKAKLIIDYGENEVYCIGNNGE